MRICGTFGVLGVFGVFGVLGIRGAVLFAIRRALRRAYGSELEYGHVARRGPRSVRLGSPSYVESLTQTNEEVKRDW